MGELPFECRILPGLRFSVGSSRFLLQRGFLREAKRHDVVLVEGSFGFLTALGVVWTKRFHRSSVVWWTSLHNPKLGRVAFPSGLRGGLLTRVLRRVDAVMTYSETAASLLRSRIPDLRNVIVVPNVLDTDELMQAEVEWLDHPVRLARFAQRYEMTDRPTILFVGRLIPAKRVKDLLRAFALLRDRPTSPRPLLAIVGDGPERSSIESLAGSLGISDDVRFVGEVRNPGDVCPFFLQAKVFVLPGAGGLAIYQALAHGLPVVATHADGTERDLIREGATGFLCDPTDIDGIARRMQMILDLEPEMWRRLSSRCRDVARRERHVRQTIERVRDAIEVAVSMRFDRAPAWQPADAKAMHGGSANLIRRRA